MRSPLAGRYSLERPLLSSRGWQRWVAIEIASGRLVIVAICETGRLSTLAPARGISHRHLATLVDVIDSVRADAFPEGVVIPAGAGAAVAEHVPGRTLRAALADGPLHAAKAVAWVLRLADAVQALHAAGAVHGAISPRSVLSAPEGRAIAPVLSQLVAPPIGPYCPPERLRGAPESQSDDVWALYAILYTALTGVAPFSAPAREGLLKAMASKPAPLQASGVDEPALQEIIVRGLVAERRGRATELSDLVAALDGWERDPKMLPPPAAPPRPSPRGLGQLVAGTAGGPARDDGVVIDDAELVDDQGRAGDVPDEDETMIARLPPAIVASAAAVAAAGSSPRASVPSPVPAAPRPPAPPKRLSFNPFERRHSVVPWVVGAALGGGGIVYLLLAPKVQSTAERPAPSVEAPVVPARVAPRPTVKKDPELVRDECVMAHFPESSFEPGTEFSFVCRDGDFRETAGKLHAVALARELTTDSDAGEPVAADAGAGIAVDVVRATRAPEPDAGAALTKLGWYELPATAIIRKTCCPGAAPVVLPETPGWCEQLKTVVRRMADDSEKAVDLAPGARSFERAVGCLYAQRIRHGYGYDRPPTPAQRAQFQKFLGLSAILSARR